MGWVKAVRGYSLDVTQDTAPADGFCKITFDGNLRLASGS